MSYPGTLAVCSLTGQERDEIAGLATRTLPPDAADYVKRQLADPVDGLLVASQIRALCASRDQHDEWAQDLFVMGLCIGGSNVFYSLYPRKENPS